VNNVLWEWRRVLKSGGVLRISVPDFDKLLAVYEACDRDSESIRVPLMGYWDGYNPHCMIFNYRYLSKILSDVGFVDIREWDADKVEHHNFEDWASKRIQKKNREFHISLNVEAVKQN
jgi:predicted SAM-dependent methyltransferase